MKTKILLTALTLFVSFQFAHAQYLVSATYVDYTNASWVKQYLENQGYNTDSMNINAIIVYKITYNTIDVFGAPTIASGALYVPQIECDTLPLISWEHGTTFKKTSVPSNYWEWVPGYLYSGNGYITTMPDYLGLGDNPGLHPYVHWESEATASLDLIRAAREYLNNSLLKWDNNQLFLAGYSQGGHSTMALHKYITINNLQSEFNVVASAPMSGPFPLYDLQLPEMMWDDSSYYASAFVPYFLASYQMVYGNLYENYNEFYDPPYDSLIADWLASGIHDYDEWSAMIPVNFYDFMQDTVLDNWQSNPNHPINIDIRANDLHNWIPEQPVRMLYCGMDSMVFPGNSIMAQDTMTTLGATDVQAFNLDPMGDHNGCFLPATTYALEWFDSLRLECEMVHVSIPTYSKLTEISQYPNPFSHATTIEYKLKIARNVNITIYNHLGQIVKSSNLGNIQPGKQQYVWNSSGLPGGVYFVQISAGQEVSTRKLIKMM